jgi:hypothetical protein
MSTARRDIAIFIAGFADMRGIAILPRRLSMPDSIAARQSYATNG